MSGKFIIITASGVGGFKNKEITLAPLGDNSSSNNNNNVSARVIVLQDSPCEPEELDKSELLPSAEHIVSIPPTPYQEDPPKTNKCLGSLIFTAAVGDNLQWR
ncbi:hypothetical protein CEXT_542851 [Caerostris extrusa]|uniref:Uncharacterized protein n=1 Tax=Caerostris extrusa TaxID=172846 RepID=A0AAV4Q8V0_CAEEX|nr:hypothetical protein CEXT_542851 [Caerostris extrusa]